MICKECSGEMAPINLEETVFECVRCRRRRHCFLPDLDVGLVRADIDGIIPIELLSVFGKDES